MMEDLRRFIAEPDEIEWDDIALTSVFVPRHLRVVEGKVQDVDAYTYLREGGVIAPPAPHRRGEVFASVKDAEDHVREKYGYGDFTGMTEEDLPALSRVIDEVDRIAAEFPQVTAPYDPEGLHGTGSRPWRFIGIGTRQVAPPNVKELWGNSWAVTKNTISDEADGPRIWLETGESFRQGTGMMGDIGFTFERTPEESIVHEMGHVMQHITSGAIDQWRYTNDRVWPWTPKSKRGPKVSISKDIAIYADRGEEGFASFFAVMNTPGGLERLTPAARRRVIAAAAEMNESAQTRSGKKGTKVV